MMLTAGPAVAVDVVEPALVGTWKLQWQRADFFWAVPPMESTGCRGPARPASWGKMEAKQGRFSMKSPIWTDAGTYALANADTLVITGKGPKPFKGW
jgi:hypothetical protein